MDRRESIKSIILGSVAGSLALQGCTPGTESKDTEALAAVKDYLYGRTPEEQAHNDKLLSETFFNPHEFETIEVLCNLILPPEGDVGGALEARVPDFIEFMTKDFPEFQATLRGGLMLLDHISNLEFNLEFKSAVELQQTTILDRIAYPDIETPEDQQPLEVRFFSLMRNLTLTGYYTSKIGIEDLGYKGNTPNVWDGVPEDVLADHNMSYDPEWLEKCVDQSKRGEMARWDKEGNLLS
jgi:hypothetical protein